MDGPTADRLLSGSRSAHVFIGLVSPEVALGVLDLSSQVDKWPHAADIPMSGNQSSAGILEEKGERSDY